MAKKLIRNYTFNAAAKTVSFTGFVNLSNLLLITNTTKNIIIYNFANANLGGTTSYNSATNTTTVTLNYNTAASMANSDTLQIYEDDLNNEFRGDASLMDAVDKFRTSTPQALIDTDFEYGTQISKWENLVMTNNRPFGFAVPTQIPNITSITMNNGSRTVTISLGSGVAPANGTAIVVQDTYLTIANGTYIIETGGLTGTFTYTARSTNTTNITSIFDANKTNVFRGSTYTGAAIGVTPNLSYTGSLINVTSSVPHGLSLGNEIAISGSTATTNAPNGSFVVASISSTASFSVYTPYGTPTGVLSGATALIYARPQGYFLHRPFDGGVIFSSNGSSNMEQSVRQTRRYFRYQSGKGIQMSSGTILKPNIQLDSITSIGTTVTVQTKEQHNIQPGTVINVLGVNEAGYNGTFTVVSVTGYNIFTYTAASTPASTMGSGLMYVSIVNWYGAVNRLGIFDQQNGLFWEFDGQKVYVVKRNSIFQTAGKVSVVSGSNFVSQTSTSFPTEFSKQLSPGDYVVIRGSSYRVLDISSDVSMSISPSYRGSTTQFAIVSKTIDYKVSQSQWNIDTMDGNGPSGYNLDLSKMQMFFVDYAWYGAGTARYGLRGTNGQIQYIHRAPQNNVNTEAYLRSGNLPGRYESSTIPPYTTLTASFLNTDTSMSVASVFGFPVSGTLLVRSASVYEYVNYVGTGSNTFNTITRGQAGNSALALTVAIGSNSAIVGSAAGLQIGQRIISSSAFPDGTFISNISGTTLTLSQAATATNPTVVAAPMGAIQATTFNYSASAPVAVELAFPTFAPALSHWGTSAIMDGRFDDDKSLLFTYGQTGSTSIPTGSSVALFSIRVSPSVDNGISAPFGSRELVNRMQLILKTLDLSTTTTGSVNILVKAVLNGIPSTATIWTNAVGNQTNVVNSSLAQIADFGGGSTTITGGETTAGFFVNGTGTQDISTVRDLGNSILGGGGAFANSQIYPDGPDVLTITATNVGTAPVNVLGRVSWTEAQA